LINKLTYDELYEKYRELELRVTRFSSTQQELINTRDLLDHELVVYKRLNTFISKAIKYKSLDDLLYLIVEATIDIFELQIGFIHFGEINSSGELTSKILCEGVNRGDQEKIIDDLLNLEKLNIFSGNIKIYEAVEIEKYFNDSLLNYCMLSKALMVGATHRLVIAAAVDKRNSPSYTLADQRKEALFGIFIKQVETIVTNFLHFERNREQMKIIRDSELELRKLSMIATKTNNAVIITNKFGCIEWVNTAFEKSTGYTLNEILGKKPRDFLQVQDERTKEAREQLKKSLKKLEYVRVEIINITKEKQEYFIELQITPIFNSEGELLNFIAIQKDVTNEVTYRKELERVNFRVEKITKGSSIGMWEFDTDSKMGVWNDVLFDLYELDESQKDNHQLWLQSIHPDDKEYVLEEIHKVISGKVKTAAFEYRIYVGQSTKNLKYVRTTAFLEEGEYQKGNLILGSTVDITATKNFENEILEKNDELMKINKELDQFVYSVSHDLRSPLLSVKGLVSLLQFPVEDKESHSYIGMINKSIDRLDNSILEILNFSRNARLDVVKTEFNLEAMVQDIFQDLSHMAENLDLHVKTSGDPLVSMDRYRVEILLKNLIGNSVKYRRADANPPFVHVAIVNKEEDCMISIKDNGEGIPQELQQKVFDMFFRASRTSQGTGLGLYLCKEIATKLNGEISLESEVGKGTNILLRLPN
jgi:PAS domain S-box-containing protein